MTLDGSVGERMLKQMGWSKGKGLGSQGQGVTKHISVASAQKSTKGIGCSTNSENYDAWWTRLYDKTASKSTVSSQSDFAISSDVKMMKRLAKKRKRKKTTC